jgi:hypothetical protein
MIKINQSFVIVLSLFLGAIFRFPAYADEMSVAAVSPSVSAEGNDYATDVLGNAWNYNEYKDISKYLNTSGVVINLSNIQVANGVFSATSTNSDAYYFPLFPGYGQNAINPGGYGINYPIQSNKYHCLSMRIKVETDSSDEIRVFWFADNRLTGGPFGVTQIIPVAANAWKIYEVDLNLSFDSINSNTSWSALPYWQGIRIDPTRYANKRFHVDWVRLTDCNPKNVTVTWSPVQANVEIWMSRQSGVLENRLLGPINGNSGNALVNVSGWEAGSYYLGVKNLSSGAVQWMNFAIESKPEITITKPSYTSGEGIFLPMNNSSELIYGVDRTRCVNHTFNNGVLEMETKSPATIGSGCVAGSYSDPQLYFNLPYQIDTTQYRYFTYRLHTQGTWQDVNKGWVGRLIWYYNRSPQQLCIAVSNDIIIDVDWERYALDLHQPGIGTPEYVEYCGTQYLWSAYPIHLLRFDPNENATSSSIFQKLDWISLNKMDEASRTVVFPIHATFSKPLDSLTLRFYYTTDIAQPRQRSLQLVSPAPPPNLAGLELLFLPYIGYQSFSEDPVASEFLWNTSGVASGTYYVCIEATDEVGNVSIRCSEAPVRVE